MRTQEQPAIEAGEPSAASPRRFRVPALVDALAGPLLIVGSIAVVLNRFIAGRLFPLQVDIRAQWLPYFCFFGRSLRQGHLPAWNPHVMAGLPSAADPQMGWLNGSAMALFGTLPCDSALRWYLFLQPVLAGLGMYWFLRSEGLSRASATLGGLALGVPIAGSGLLGLPWLSAALAWSAVALAAASRWLRSETWPARLGWLAVTALAWGQLAAAHFSHGLVLGTAALLLYVAARLVSDIRTNRRSWQAAAVMLVLFAAYLILVNLAFLVPRLAYLPRTSQSLGYQRLDALSLSFSRGAGDGDAIAGLKLNGAWPLSMALSPGIYLGAAALALSMAAFWLRGKRHVAIGFAIFAAGCYLLTVTAVYEVITSKLGDSKLAGLYMHSPRRFQFGLVLAVPVLAALGLEAWRERRSPLARVAMIAPGALIWWLVPWTTSAPHRYLSVLLIGMIAGCLALAGAAVKSFVVPLVPLIVAVELAVSGMAGQDMRLHEDQGRVWPFFPPLMAAVDLDAYMRAGPIVRQLRSHPGDRYMSLDSKGWRNWGYTGRLKPDELGLLGGQRAMIFGLEEAQGYNPVELLRYWTFVRKLDPKKMRYAVSYFRHPPPTALDLLDVRWVVTRRGTEPPVPGAIRSVREGRWRLYQRRGSSNRASLLYQWRAVPSPAAALRAVSDPRFRPDREAVIEGSSSTAARSRATGPKSDRATFRELGPQKARVDVIARKSAVLVIRNAYDPNWTATVDGRPANVIPADYVSQGVLVPRGRHTVVLSYDDAYVGYGLLGSALSLLALGVAALLASRGRGVRSLFGGKRSGRPAGLPDEVALS